MDSHFLDWWKQQDLSVKYAILDANDIKSDCNLVNYPNVKVYIQPGGNAYYQQKQLGSVGKTNINNYINSGRGYVGICAGFYYAAGDYYWQGSYYNWPNLLNKYPTVEGSITNIADYDSSSGYALTTLSNGEQMIYYGGPTRGWRQTPSSFPGQALMSFASISNNLPASIEYNNMLLMSVHAEAYENDGIYGLTTNQRVRNYIWFANAINNVSGTSFYVPVLPSSAVCGNGICEAGEDSYSCPADCYVSSGNVTNIFYDDFESGLGNWATTAVSGGNSWNIATTDPYQGSYAESNPMSTTDPASILEKGISTVGYGNIKVSYYRKLVGLDIADEFQAKWFDGVNWNILEQTGSNSADDVSYLYKEFNILAMAYNNSNFKIRFECTAGAVSEFCRVDNVLVSGQ
ncbi:MAG: BPL-N domain-containing protein [Nanoarchaeota archaeon]|mgnify:CR=1 FL=1